MKLQKVSIYLFSFFILLMGVGCNSDEESESYTVSGNTLVKSFSLSDKSGSDVPYSSCFFTIDAVNGYIFNADSLPYKSDISSLVANITFSSASAVEIAYTKQDEENVTTVDYLTNSTDSLDFSGKPWTDTDKKASVKMTVTAPNGNKQIYYIDVRVHQIVADSLQWKELTKTELPSALASPTVQKTVLYKETLYCFTGDGSSYSLATSQRPSEIALWNKEVITPGFVLNVGSIQSAPDYLYALSDAGELYRSADGKSWESVAIDKPFYSLIGVWTDSEEAPADIRLLGVIKDGDTYKHDCYPRPEGYAPRTIENDFPVSGYSNMIVIYEGGDYGLPQTAFVGGRLADGSLTAAVWGYDGEADGWAKLGVKSLITPREGAMFFPYCTYTYDSSTGVRTEWPTFFVVGGSDGYDCLKYMYTTSNPAQYWDKVKDGSVLALPEAFPATSFASVVVFKENVITKSSLAGWNFLKVSELPRYMKSADGLTDGLVPYIYMFGGEDSGGNLERQMWRGVINRLTFAPIP